MNNYGITPLVIKAGEMKNPLSSIGPVTKDEIKKETERLEKVHEAFVQMCVSRRSGLNTSVCDGSVWIGSQAIRYGMVDRVLTSGTFQAVGGGEGVSTRGNWQACWWLRVRARNAQWDSSTITTYTRLGRE